MSKELLIDFWNSRFRHDGIPKIRIINDKAIGAIERKLKVYELNELIESIVLYDTILTGHTWFEPIIGFDDLFYCKYRHSISEFFRDGINKEAPFCKYMLERDPLVNLIGFKYKRNWTPIMRESYVKLFEREVEQSNNEIKDILYASLTNIMATRLPEPA